MSTTEDFEIRGAPEGIMEGRNDTRVEPVEGAWEREARRVRRLAARRGMALDEERLLLLDVHELMALRQRLEMAPRRDDRRLVRALVRLVGRLQRLMEPGRWTTGVVSMPPQRSANTQRDANADREERWLA